MADTLTTTRWVYAFGGGGADGDATMKNLLGGKGANLAEMAMLGLPVPPGFTVTTEACVHYYANGKQYPAELAAQIAAGLKKVEEITGKTFGDASNPLLVSVRSGARASMPGMMDTVLNLGLNDQTVEGLRHKTKPVFCVQYHPEAAPGPHDSSVLFDEFRDLVAKRG